MPTPTSRLPERRAWYPVSQTCTTVRGPARTQMPGVPAPVLCLFRCVTQTRLPTPGGDAGDPFCPQPQGGEQAGSGHHWVTLDALRSPDPETPMSPRLASGSSELGDGVGEWSRLRDVSSVPTPGTVPTRGCGLDASSHWPRGPGDCSLVTEGMGMAQKLVQVARGWSGLGKGHFSGRCRKGADDSSLEGWGGWGGAEPRHRAACPRALSRWERQPERRLALVTRGAENVHWDSLRPLHGGLQAAGAGGGLGATRSGTRGHLSSQASLLTVAPVWPVDRRCVISAPAAPRQAAGPVSLSPAHGRGGMRA